MKPPRCPCREGMAPGARARGMRARWLLHPVWLVACGLGCFPLATATCFGVQADASQQATAPGAAADEVTAGNQLLAAHHDPEAMDHFETALALDARNPDARHGELRGATELALNARRARHPEVALEVLRHATTILPDEAQLQFERGVQAFELHLLPEASAALTTALALRPNDAATLYALARVETEEQLLPAAELHLRAVLAAQPNDASAHFGLGRLLAMEQRTAEARAEFDQSIRLQPEQTESFYQLGQIALEAHEDAVAKPLFEHVLQRAPTHAGALTGLGELALRAKDYAAAERLLGQAEAADPDYAPPHYFRGLALAHLGRQAEADAELHSEAGRTHVTAPPAEASSPSQQ